jgi:hypothetical protein
MNETMDLLNLLVDSHLELDCDSTTKLAAGAQDPTGTIGAGVHSGVLEKEPHFGPGAVLMLKQVRGFGAFAPPQLILWPAVLLHCDKYRVWGRWKYWVMGFLL